MQNEKRVCGILLNLFETGKYISSDNENTHGGVSLWFGEKIEFE